MSHSAEFNEAVRTGDMAAITRLLPRLSPDALNIEDDRLRSPLSYAAESSEAGVDVLRVLIEHGASLEAPAGWEYEKGRTALSFAISAGDPAKVEVLLDAGANLNYSRDGFGAMLDAVHGRDIRCDTRLLALLKLLIARGARLNDVSRYEESALRVLSNRGRFDAVMLLLDAGADEVQLQWSSLTKAVAIGTLADIEIALAAGAALEHRDFWKRTPLLVAIMTGDITKVRRLIEHGSDVTATGRCAKPPFFYAIQEHHEPMLLWLLSQGFSLRQTDEFGTPALTAAAEENNLSAVRILLDAGMDPDEKSDHLNALYSTSSPAIARVLLNAGADPGSLPFEMRRALAGLPSTPELRLLQASEDEFQRGWHRRFGIANPEEMTEPFWRNMVVSGVSGYEAENRFTERTAHGREPVWCAQRFGQSITFLADGRVIQIGGEHEDSYDPDFCIYNDVFVHEIDGSFRMF
ncbi:MAG: ankyrin repeat domain-containing protein, partial [Rudaea sp.]|nr:ankyrin repeat domain-containing protein [Rudaea sp.]